MIPWIGFLNGTNQGQPLDLTPCASPLAWSQHAAKSTSQVHRRGLIPRIRSILSSFALLL